MGKQCTANQRTLNDLPNRIAILDLGTNTFHLLIADLADRNHPVIIFQETIAVKLGEGGISEGVISEKAFERGIEAIIAFKESIDYYRVIRIKSAATSAIRSASNGADFLEKIKLETGLDLEIIDGGREAELIYIGVREALVLENVSLIVDIGGGSVELIICDKHQILWKKSYPIGAARMMAKFHQTDPISDSEIMLIQTYLKETLTDLQIQLDLYQPDTVIGSAGAFETFARLQDSNFKTSFENPEQAINIQGFNRISNMIIKSSHVEREQMSDISPVRVDMIVVASILTDHILKMRDFRSFKLSCYSLKEGLLFEMLK